MCENYIEKNSVVERGNPMETAERQSSVLNTTEKASRDARFYEYTKAADPIGAGLIPQVPYHNFMPDLYDSGPTRIVPLDLSREIDTTYAATGPGMLANFIRIVSGEEVSLDPNASSQVFYVLEGEGSVQQAGTEFNFGPGDFFTLPGGNEACVSASATARIYYVHDAPLFDYLGATVSRSRFEPTLYPSHEAKAELHKALNDPESKTRNRVSILLGNAHFPETRTITQTLWTMYGIVPKGAVQKPHRHQSLALDFIGECKPGCYTLVGTEIDEQGNIVNPTRVDWHPGMVFVTPPGYWHAHYNESGEEAYVIPFQDAGLHTYLRTLNIQFSK